jgi:hypothetical protein
MARYYHWMHGVISNRGTWSFCSAFSKWRHRVGWPQHSMESIKEGHTDFSSKTLASQFPPKKQQLSEHMMILIGAIRLAARITIEHKQLTWKVKKTVLKDRKAMLIETCMNVAEAERNHNFKEQFILVEKLTKRFIPNCTNIWSEGGSHRGYSDPWPVATALFRTS